MVTSNVWHHAAATYDGTTWRSTSTASSTRPLAWSATSRRESDSIQHAALGTAMTSTGAGRGLLPRRPRRGAHLERRPHAAQILSTGDQELTTGTGLIARYGLNEGSGTTVGNSDRRPAPTGTLTNGPTWVAGFPLADDRPPAAPTGLHRDHRQQPVVGLSWNANSESDLAGYHVYRSTTTPG